MTSSEIYKAQVYLQRLGFDPGPLDGLWGPQTSGAAFDFRTWAGLPPASDLTASAVMDSAFMAALWWKLADAGQSTEVGSAPAGGSSGGTSVTPTPRSGSGSLPSVPRSASANLFTSVPTPVWIVAAVGALWFLFFRDASGASSRKSTSGAVRE